MLKTTRQDVADALAVKEPAALRAVLDHARIDPGDATTPRELADRIASALWWSYCTPLGLVVNRTTFDDIVDHVAHKLQLAGALAPGDAWGKLRQMTAILLREKGPVALEDLDPEVRSRMVPSWKRTAAYAGGASSSFGAFAAGRGIVWISRTPIGQLLPYAPYIGPWVRTIYSGGRAAALFGGPAGIALSILAANNAMGTNYQRLVPLLFGVGALGTDRVEEAVVIEA